MKTEFKALVINTFQKELRSKTLYIIFAFTVLLIILVNVFVDFLYNNMLDESATQMIGDKTAMVVYLAIDFWSFFLCILFGANTIRSDISSGTLGQLLSFPIKRSTYLWARILGSCSIIYFYYIASLVIAVGLFSLTQNKMIGGLEMIYALGPSFLNIFILMILTINFGLYLPRMITFISVSFLSLLVTLSNKALMSKSITEQFEGLGVVKSVGVLLHYIFPRIGVVSDSIGVILFNNKLDFTPTVEITHLVIALIFWIFITIKLFEKEDF